MEKWKALDDKTRKQRAADEGQIVDPGSPLEKTKHIAGSGITDVRNNLAAYTIVKAESHDAAAKWLV